MTGVTYINQKFGFKYYVREENDTSAHTTNDNLSSVLTIGSETTKFYGFSHKNLITQM